MQSTGSWRVLLDLDVCRESSEPPSPPRGREPARLLLGVIITKVVDGRNRGASIDAELGETILVRLDETPTSGYRWALDHLDKEVLAAEASEFELPANAAIGAAGQRTFTFKAIGHGIGHIALALRRRWEDPGPAVDQFEISVRVGERQ